MKLLRIIGFLLVAHLHAESNFCTFLFLAFKHNASAESLSELLRRRKANPNTTRLEDTYFIVTKSVEKIFKVIVRNAIASIDHLRYNVAPFAILVTFWIIIWDIIAWEKNGPGPLILILRYVFLLSQSLRILEICIAYDLLHINRWNNLGLKRVEAEYDSNQTFLFIEFDRILEQMVEDLFV